MQQARLLRQQRNSVQQPALFEPRSLANTLPSARLGFGGHKRLSSDAAVEPRSTVYTPVDARTAGADMGRLSARARQLPDVSRDDLLIRDILHAQTWLAERCNDRSAPAIARWVHGPAYSEKDLRSMASEPEAQGRRRLSEILLQALVRMQQAALGAVDPEFMAQSARGETSSSHLPYFYAVIERLKALAAKRDAPAHDGSDCTDGCPAPPIMTSTKQAPQTISVGSQTIWSTGGAAAALALIATYSSALRDAEDEATMAWRAAHSARGETAEASAHKNALEEETSELRNRLSSAEAARAEAEARAVRSSIAESVLRATVVELEAQLRSVTQEADSLRCDMTMVRTAAAGDALRQVGKLSDELEETRLRLDIAEQATEAQRAQNVEQSRQLASARSELLSLAAVQHESSRALAETRKKLTGMELMAEELREEKATREAAEREAAALRREAELLADAEGETFERVLAEEMVAMRTAYEARLACMQEEIRLTKVEQVGRLSAALPRFAALTCGTSRLQSSWH